MNLKTVNFFKILKRVYVMTNTYHQYQEPLRQFQSLRNQIYILSIIKLRMKGL